MQSIGAGVFELKAADEKRGTRSGNVKNANPNNKPGHITTGDIFDDLGFSAAETLEMKVKAEIWHTL
jgi:hypothetical protein